MIYLVGRLLEVTNFPDDVSNLLNVTQKQKQKNGARKFNEFSDKIT